MKDEWKMTALLVGFGAFCYVLGVTKWTTRSPAASPLDSKEVSHPGLAKAGESMTPGPPDVVGERVSTPPGRVLAEGEGDRVTNPRLGDRVPSLEAPSPPSSTGKTGLAAPGRWEVSPRALARTLASNNVGDDESLSDEVYEQMMLFLAYDIWPLVHWEYEAYRAIDHAAFEYDGEGPRDIMHDEVRNRLLAHILRVAGVTEGGEDE